MLQMFTECLIVILFVVNYSVHFVQLKVILFPDLLLRETQRLMIDENEIFVQIVET